MGTVTDLVDQVPGYPRREPAEPVPFSSQAGLSTFVVGTAETVEVAA